MLNRDPFYGPERNEILSDDIADATIEDPERPFPSEPTDQELHDMFLSAQDREFLYALQEEGFNVRDWL